MKFSNNKNLLGLFMELLLHSTGIITFLINVDQNIVNYIVNDSILKYTYKQNGCLIYHICCSNFI